MRTPTIRRGSSVALAFVVGLLLALAGCADDAGDGAQDDDRLPALTLAAVRGGEIDLAAPVDVPRVVNLWATWCFPCRAELPAFDAVARSADGTVQIIGVNIGDTEESAAAFVDELGLGFDQLLDPDGALDRELEVVNMPTTVFVRADGTIASTHAGALDAGGLVELIEEHLGVVVDEPTDVS